MARWGTHAVRCDAGGSMRRALPFYDGPLRVFLRRGHRFGIDASAIALVCYKTLASALTSGGLPAFSSTRTCSVTLAVARGSRRLRSIKALGQTANFALRLTLPTLYTA